MSTSALSCGAMGGAALNKKLEGNERELRIAKALLLSNYVAKCKQKEEDDFYARGGANDFHEKQEEMPSTLSLRCQRRSGAENCDCSKLKIVTACAKNDEDRLRCYVSKGKVHHFCRSPHTYCYIERKKRHEVHHCERRDGADACKCNEKRQHLITRCFLDDIRSKGPTLVHRCELRDGATNCNCSEIADFTKCLLDVN